MSNSLAKEAVFVKSGVSFRGCAPGASRTLNLIVRTDVLYPLSYGGYGQIIAFLLLSACCPEIMFIPGHKENLYGNGYLPPEELALIELGYIAASVTEGGKLMHPEDRAIYKFNPENPLANICDLATKGLGEIYGKGKVGARVGKHFIFKSREAYLQRKKRISPHYDYRHPGMVPGDNRDPMEVPYDLTMCQNPAEAFIVFKCFRASGFNFSHAEMPERWALCKQAMRETVVNGVARLDHPTPQIVAFAELLEKEHRLNISP